MTEIKDKAAVTAKVRALLMKTQENGCSEGEALAAAEKAKAFILQYDLSRSEIEFERDTYTAKSADAGTRLHPVVRGTADAIAAYTSTQCWLSGFKGRDQSKLLNYFGEEGDVEIAFYMSDMFRAIAELELKAWRASPQYYHNVNGNKARTSFLCGFATRIRERLLQLKTARDQLHRDRTGTGRDLMVVKAQVVERKFAELGIHMTAAKRHRVDADAASWDAGERAGEHASISDGLEDERAGPHAAITKGGA